MLLFCFRWLLDEWLLIDDVNFCQEVVLLLFKIYLDSARDFLGGCGQLVAWFFYNDLRLFYSVDWVLLFKRYSPR